MTIAVRWLTFLVILTVSFYPGGSRPSGLAQTLSTQDDPTPTRRLKVGIKTLPPFVINRPIELSSTNPQAQAAKQQLEFVGIDIAIWEAIAAVQKWEYDYFEYATVANGLSELEQGNLDILLGGLEITPERLNQVNFTQPYYFSHAALLIRRPPLPFWNYLHPFLRIAVLTAIAVVFLFISLFSHLIWLAERQENPEHFPRQYWRGISQAYWFTAVTMTTVGYGDTVPITGMGRRLTFVWMWIGMVLTSSITAALASGFTLSITQQLDTGDLQNHDLSKKIAVIGDTLSLTFLKDQPVPLVQTQTFNDAITLLNNRQVESILYFDDSLAYFQQTQTANHYELIDLDSVPIAYGFALRLNDPLLQKVNISLLEMMRSKQLSTIVRQFTTAGDN
ncbi:MAG: transporter substrate-binding domain-containing protein [Synechocystis sp.]|nr:transporter substrate-binding domain-containing protein [Synechocystis sp.]